MAPPWMLVVLLYAYVVWPIHAVTCRDKIFNMPVPFRPPDYETKTCVGDYCMATVNRTGYISRIYCMNGTAFASFNNRCWSADSYQSTSTCLCNTNFCSDKPQPTTSWQGGNVNCGISYFAKNCSSCEVKSYSTSPDKQEYCRLNRLSAIEDVLRPQSCVRISNGAEEYVRCVCDSANLCADKLFAEQKLRSSEGSLCYTQRYGVRYNYNYDDFSHRGCITNNETLFPGLYQVGHIITNDDDCEFAICNKPSCNSNWTTAMSNTPTTTSTASSSSTSTTIAATSTIPSTSTSTTSSPSSTTSTSPISSSTVTPFTASTISPSSSTTTSVTASTITNAPSTPSAKTTTPADSETSPYVESTPWYTTENAASMSTTTSIYISTTAPSKQAIFESEYMKFFSTMKQALDQFIGKLIELTNFCSDKPQPTTSWQGGNVNCGIYAKNCSSCEVKSYSTSPNKQEYCSLNRLSAIEDHYYDGLFFFHLYDNCRNIDHPEHFSLYYLITIFFDNFHLPYLVVDPFTASTISPSSSTTTSVTASTITNAPSTPSAKTTTPAGMSTTTSRYISITAPSKQAIFESEYMKFFSTVKQSLDQFIGKLFELYR
ncbi:hypothetical protein PRIPAC_89247 [Pristionchus pacificus]|uniref:Uncharacterized protein n=1 Tax=Pristionchus pacificus TaxID=54126 RepID=A0A2A6CY44_PRIPA|nr:hypothetical protein PRIPAC_89247 [Pristionchus pacificus]|eukprot:PDM82987.1 hypothetical protein PRIPAC_37380 [Pristionchus pacificus]